MRSQQGSGDFLLSSIPRYLIRAIISCARWTEMCRSNVQNDSMTTLCTSRVPGHRFPHVCPVIGFLTCARS
eukprot:206618-Prorocentrum_minimum.AAC.2